MLKNYKNFKEEIVIDFQGISGYQFSQDCITDGIISKMLIQQKILRDLLMNLNLENRHSYTSMLNFRIRI